MSASAALLAFSMEPAGLFSQANFRGRLNLDYLSTRFEDTRSQNFDQELDISVADALFTKNLLTLSYFLQRYSAGTQPGGAIRQRWRTNMTGKYYTFTGDLSPRYRLNSASGPAALHGRGRRFNLVVSPPKAPVTSVTYDRNERVGGGTGAGRVDMLKVDRLVNMTYEYKFMNYRSLLRERKMVDRVDNSGNRRIRDISGGLGARIPFPRRASLTVDYDYLYTDDRGGPEFIGKSMVNNMSARASIKPLARLSGYTSFLGNYIRREGQGSENSSLSEVVSGMRFMPTDYLSISGSRDYRRIMQEGGESTSDFLRAEARLHGRIRERIEGRAAFTRTYIIRSKEGSFPSHGYLFSVVAQVYRGISLNSDYNITQSENPGVTTGRFQVRRTLDLRTVPTGRLMLDFGLRTLSYGEKVPWLDTQSSTLQMSLNYQPAPRLTTLWTVAREDDRRVFGRHDYLVTGTLNYLFSGGSGLSLIYNRRNSRSRANGEALTQPTSFSGAQEGLLFQMNLKLRERANLRLSLDTQMISGNRRISNLGINLVKWF